MSHALSIVNSFSCVSDLEINKKKSEAMWLGRKKHCTDTVDNSVWEKKLKILGVYFCNDMCASRIQDKWLERIAKQRGKKMSIMGKICIV